MASSTSTRLESIDLPGRNPRWEGEILEATASSTTMRTALAKSLLSALVTFRGLTLSTAWPISSCPEFPGGPFGMKNNRLWLKSSANSRSLRGPSSLQMSPKTSCNTSTGKCSMRRQAKKGRPSGPGEEQLDPRMASRTCFFCSLKLGAGGEPSTRLPPGTS